MGEEGGLPVPVPEPCAWEGNSSSRGIGSPVPVEREREFVWKKESECGRWCKGTNGMGCDKKMLTGAPYGSTILTKLSLSTDVHNMAAQYPPFHVLHTHDGIEQDRGEESDQEGYFESTFTFSTELLCVDTANDTTLTSWFDINHRCA